MKSASDRPWAGRIAWLAVAAAIWLGGGVAADGGQTLTIRLVEASTRGAGVSMGLGDVKMLLEQNLPYRSYKEIDRKAVRLPANETVTLKGGYVVRCSGLQDRLQVTVEREGYVLVQTVLNLHDRKPFVLGGFESNGGKSMIILVVS
jgi:hypothetical protein